MAFLKLTGAGPGSKPLWLRANAIVALTAIGSDTRVDINSDYFDVTESPDAILAAIADASGGADVAFEEARDHLGAALMQTVPSDDQRIIGHIRSAHSLLTATLRARRQP